MRKTLAILLLAGATFLTGCGSSDDFVFTQNGLVAAPTCVDDNYATNSNTQLTVAAANGVLSNDSPAGGTLVLQTASSQGGTVADNGQGAFTYTPATNFAGTDTFTYSITNAVGTTTCTVTITVTAVNGFFVDSANGNDGTGSFTNGLPFATIQAAAAAAPAGSDIVVRPGNYTGAINLDNGDRLLGSGSVLAQGAVPRPVLTGPVVLGDGCTVDFVRIENSPGLGIDGDGQASGTITNCEVVNSTGTAGIQVRPGTGTWNISNNTLTNNQQIGIAFQTNGTGTMTATVNNNNITGSGSSGLGFVTENTSQCNAQVQGNTMTGNQAGFTFEVISTETSVFCLDLENNTNDDVYLLSNSDDGSVLNVEELVLGPPDNVPSNTGTVTVDRGVGFFADPTSQANGFCGF